MVQNGLQVVNMTMKPKRGCITNAHQQTHFPDLGGQYAKAHKLLCYRWACPVATQLCTVKDDAKIPHMATSAVLLHMQFDNSPSLPATLHELQKEKLVKGTDSGDTYSEHVAWWCRVSL